MIQPDSLLVPFRVVPHSDGWIGVTAGAPEFWLSAGADSEMEASGAYPTDSIAAWPPLLRQSLVTVLPGSSTWAAVFVFGDRFAIYDGTELRCLGVLPGAEGPPTKYSEPSDVTIHAAGVALTGPSLLVLRRAQGTDDDLRVVEQYSAADCSFTRRMRLPVVARGIAATPELLYVVVREPVPAIIAFRLDDSGASE